MSIFGGGGGGSAPKAPALVRTRIPQAEQAALGADVLAYGRSDQDFAQQFPELLAGRQYNVNNAAMNLQGGTDPAVSGALKGAGFGDVNMGNTVFEQARNMGQPILAKEQRDRNYFQTLLGDNPQRAFGLSGEDVANIALSNIGQQNNYNQGIYATRIQGANQAVLQNAQNTAALLGAIGSIGSAGIRAYGNSQTPQSPTLNASYYQPNPWIYSGAYNPSASVYGPGGG